MVKRQALLKWIIQLKSDCRCGVFYFWGSCHHHYSEPQSSAVFWDLPLCYCRNLEVVGDPSLDTMPQLLQNDSVFS